MTHPASLPRGLLHAIVTLGGAAALSWESVWQLQASLAFGVSALGTALTLAAVMGGMTTGSLLAGWLLRDRQVRSPLRLYGWLELAIGVSGLFVLPGFRLLGMLDVAAWNASEGLASVAHALGVALLLLPPTAAMGATIPVFQLIARGTGVRVSLLYGLNTAGAAVGILLFSFGLLPWLGVARTCLLLALCNAIVFAVSRAVTREASGRPVEAPATPAAAPAPRLPLALAQLLVFVTGFVTFGLEVAWFRSLRGAFWSTNGTFAIMLASVLAPLALGARLVPAMRRRDVSIPAVLTAAGAAILLGTPLVERMDLLGNVEGSYPFVVASWLLLSLACIGPAIALLGILLPWCLEEFPVPGPSARLYAANAAGAVAGSLLTAWLLLPTLGAARAAWLLGLLVIAAALLRAGRPMRLIAAGTGAAALALAVAFTSTAGRDRMQRHADWAGMELVAFRESPDATTSVIAGPAGTRALWIDGFSATSEHEQGSHYMRWMGHLPMLLHEAPESALVICFGTGQTSNAVRREGPTRLDVVDVNPAVFELADRFDSNQQVLRDRRVQTHVMDGRAWLRRTTGPLDVVTLEPMPPNFAGVNSLYSLEFYRIVAQRLRPGGVVAQWLPIHLVTPRHATAIAATFRAVFPDAILWFDRRSSTGILLGRSAGSPTPLGADWPGLERQPIERTLGGEEIREGLEAGLDHLELARYAESGELITDDNQLLANSTLRAGMRGRRAQALLRANRRLLRRFGADPLSPPEPR